MDKTPLTTTARKLASAALLILSIFAADLARPIATTTGRLTATTTTEGI